MYLKLLEQCLKLILLYNQIKFCQRISNNLMSRKFSVTISRKLHRSIARKYHNPFAPSFHSSGSKQYQIVSFQRIRMSTFGTTILRLTFTR